MRGEWSAKCQGDTLNCRMNAEWHPLRINRIKFLPINPCSNDSFFFCSLMLIQTVSCFETLQSCARANKYLRTILSMKILIPDLRLKAQQVNVL